MVARVEGDVARVGRALGELQSSRNPQTTEQFETSLRVARQMLRRTRAMVPAGDAQLASRVTRIEQQLESYAEAGRARRGPVAAPLPHRARMETAFGADFSGVQVRLGAASEMDAIGAQAITGREQITFASHDPDPELVAHELTHVVQQRQGATGVQAKALGAGNDGDALEAEANSVAARVARGEPAGPIRGATQRTGLRDDGGKRKPAADVPDLGNAPYQWVAGTYKLWVRQSWFTSAADFEGGDRWRAPSRIRELLSHLREKGMLSWVKPDVIARASKELDVNAFTAEVFAIDLNINVFDVIGLPPGTQTLVGRTSDGGLEVVASVPDVKAAYGSELKLSDAHKEQVLAALERYTGMPIVPEKRRLVLEREIKAALGAGTVLVKLDRAGCGDFFGDAAYKSWLEQKDAEPADGNTAITTDGDAQVTDLSADEAAWAQQWLKTNLKAGGKNARPVVLTKLLLERLREIDMHPERERILRMLSGSDSTDGQLATDVLERVINEAQFEAEREEMGLADIKRGKARPPTFDWPIPARIDQRSGLVLSGETVDFRIVIDWPPAYTADQASDLRWRRYAAEIDWVFERVMPDGSLKRDRRHVITEGGSEGVKHRFKLEPKETEATWTVHAFVRHSHFQSKHITTQVQVKTETKRLEDLRAESFQGLGTPQIANDRFNFDTSTYNERSVMTSTTRVSCSAGTCLRDFSSARLRSACSRSTRRSLSKSSSSRTFARRAFTAMPSRRASTNSRS